MMNLSNQVLLDQQIKQYNDCNCEETKIKIRNEIFLSLSPIFNKWVKKISGNHKVYMSDSERLSFCWDCFLFCIKYYDSKNNIPILKHSYTYSNFFFLSWLSKQENQETNIDDCSEKENNPEKYYSQIDELKKFRLELNEDDQKIFDDAILSIAGSNKDKIGYVKSTAYSQYKYRITKKIFKTIITFLLKR